MSSSSSSHSSALEANLDSQPGGVPARRRQGVFWLLTIPFESDNANPSWSTELPSELTWIRGQVEEGEETGYRHWQVCCAFRKKVALAGVTRLFGRSIHAELSRSESASKYVWKEETRVAGTQFELGTKPFRRNSATDWESVWESAKTGKLDSIPANVRVVNYRTLRSIAADHDVPMALERSCYVFWGKTGTGKSRRAWDEAGLDAYCKDPRTKFWCGYQGQSNVVIDEFRGGIDISHLLRWLDRYPVRVEIKGSSRPLVATKIWITSNLEPKWWYPDVDPETLAALLRRLNITEFE